MEVGRKSSQSIKRNDGIVILQTWDHGGLSRCGGRSCSVKPQTHELLREKETESHVRILTYMGQGF